MNYEFARTNFNNMLKRKTIINSICNAFNDIGQKKVVFNLIGNSGVGKSYICKFIYNSNKIVHQNNKVLIDFNQITNNNLPSIIQTIIVRFGLGNFCKTQEVIDKYYKSVDASKTIYLSKCLNIFVEELNQYAYSSGYILIIFDTFEAISVNIEKNSFKQIVELSSRNIGFLIAGTKRFNFSQCIPYNIGGFDEIEIQEYLIGKNPRIKNAFKKHGLLLASQIKEYTDDGNPILCGLLSDWLLHCQDISIQIDYLINSNETSRKHLVNWINDLNDSLCTALRLTAFFNDRMTTKLLSSLSNMNVQKCKECLIELTNFTFVKSFSEEFDIESQIVLHDVAAKIIRDYFPFPESQLNYFVKRAIEVYNQMILEDRTNSKDFRLGQSLRVEKIMIMVRNGKLDDALVMFDDEILDSIEIFDYSFVDQIINEIKNHINSLSINFMEEKEKWKYMLQVANAEIELSKYNTNDAIKIYNNLKEHSLYKSNVLYKAIAEDIYARVLINPSTANCCKTPSEAINIINYAIIEIEKSGLNRRLVRSYYWLGNAFVRDGQNDNGQIAYNHALSLCKNDIQKVMILLDLSKMLRLQQDVGEALKPLQKCDAIMENLQKNKGKYYYYKGNVYRDLDDIETAMIYYNKAFNVLANGDDNFTLCELNLDYAWLQYIRDDVKKIDIEEFEKYLETGWTYAKKYQFGAEYSEYYHMRYEIKNFLGDYQNAFKDLNCALDFAYQYSNIYMILDCLNHRVQQYYQENRVDEIPNVIQEMERIEKSGCKIRVFRGRAKLVQADVYFDRGLYELALQEYFDGFVIVALYGNSRSNVELFNDLYSNKTNSNPSRREKMVKCMHMVSEPKKFFRKFLTIWNKNNISPEFRCFLDDLKRDNKNLEA